MCEYERAHEENGEESERDIDDASERFYKKEYEDMKALYKELNTSAYQLSTVNYRMDAIPAPYVVLKSLNSSDITFSVRAWVRGADYWDVFFALQERFYTELPPQGFGFAYPHVQIVPPATSNLSDNSDNSDTLG